MKTQIDILRAYEFFSKLTYEAFEEVYAAHIITEAKKGDYIYFESQHLNRLFFIREGYIKIGCIDNTGNEIIKEILKPGDLFGQLSLECKNMNGEFSQAYKSDVVLCSFTVEDFTIILEKNPLLAISYSQKVGNRLRKMENRLVNILNTDVKTRLLRFFDDMVQSQLPACTGNTAKLDNFLTHYDVARLIGSTRQTVTTLFNEPDMQRLMQFGRKQIVINDIRSVQLMSAY
jgi:CRP/FNR family transcriptional regulator, cyclic AMP receptor protein